MIREIYLTPEESERQLLDYQERKDDLKINGCRICKRHPKESGDVCYSCEKREYDAQYDIAVF